MAARSLSNGSTNIPRALSHPSRTSKRTYADLVIKSTTGRPILGAGPGGRHSTTGHVATVFGCTGFLGRYIVSKLARQGTQVVVPYRDADEVRFLRPLGDLGQIVPLEWDLKSDAMIQECVRHSDIVYSCLGRTYETKNFSFDDVHNDGPGRIAHIAHSEGVSRFVHVSHINANATSPSVMLRAKASGERAVSNFFPGATIVRPSWMFGAEDELLNSVAQYPWLFRLNKQETKFRPVHVLDVAEACKVMMDAESTVGKTFSLIGTKKYTFKEFIELSASVVFKDLQGRNIPKWAIIAASKMWSLLPFAQVKSPDDILQRHLNEQEPEPGTLGFSELGIQPESLEQLAIVYLRPHRPAASFATLITKGGINVLPKKQFRIIQ